MAETCAVYASRRELLTLEVLRGLSPEATFTLTGPESNWTELRVVFPDAELHATRWSLGETRFGTHLAAALQRLGARFGGAVDARSSAVLERMARTKHVLGLTANPGFDTRPKVSAFVRAWATAVHGVVSTGPTLLDAEGRLLVGEDKTSDPDAVLWVSNDAAQRKQRSQGRLSALRVPVNQTLPPLDGADESWMRTAEEIARRAQVVWVLALRGEGLEAGEARGMLQEVGLWTSATEADQTQLNTAQLSEEAARQAAWQYEALWVLLWALGHVPELAPPTGVCDVGAASSFLSEAPVRAFLEQARLRPLGELLDESDVHERFLDAALRSRRAGMNLPASLNLDVLLERARAFRWMFRHHDRAWEAPIVE